MNLVDEERMIYECSNDELLELFEQALDDFRNEDHPYVLGFCYYFLKSHHINIYRREEIQSKRVDQIYYKLQDAYYVIYGKNPSYALWFSSFTRKPRIEILKKAIELLKSGEILTWIKI